MSYKDDSEDQIVYHTPPHYRTKFPTKNVLKGADAVEKFQSKHGIGAAIYFLLGEMHSKIDRFNISSNNAIVKSIEDTIKIEHAAKRLNSLLIDLLSENK